MIITGHEKPLENYSKNELVEIAKRYNIYYETALGKGSMSGYSKLPKDQLIKLIKEDRDYQRGGPKKPPQKPNRFRDLKESLKGNETPEELMDEILRLAENTSRNYIEAGKYYTFVYYAKTPGIRYDRHPLIKGGILLPRGFNGLNFHWFNQIRQYNTEDGTRLVSPLYEVTGTELATLRTIPYRKIIQN